MKKLRLSSPSFAALIGAVVAALVVFFAPMYSQEQGIPVLLYHHVLPEAYNRNFIDNSAVISLENFTEQMQYLYDNDFHALSLDELYAILFEGADIPPRSVMIQFDDGYYSNIVYALPVLRDFGFIAQLFLITHLVEDQGDYQPLMDHDDLTWTAAYSLIGTEDVFETASHTHNLHRMDDFVHSTGTLLYVSSREQIIEDTRRSFEFVNDHRAFAYPRGQYNDIVIEALRYAGIRMAFTVQEGYITANTDSMRLNRFVIFRDTNMSRFHNIVHGRRSGIVSRVLSRIGEF